MNPSDQSAPGCHDEHVGGLTLNVPLEDVRVLGGIENLFVEPGAERLAAKKIIEMHALRPIQYGTHRRSLFVEEAHVPMQVSRNDTTRDVVENLLVETAELPELADVRRVGHLLAEYRLNRSEKVIIDLERALGPVCLVDKKKPQWPASVP